MRWLPAFADLRQIWVEAEALELSRRRVFRGRIGEQRNPIVRAMPAVVW